MNVNSIRSDSKLRERQTQMCDVKEKLQTAAEWCRELNCSIIDPDGWRYKNGAIDFFETLITRKEFDIKLSASTTKHGFDQAHEDRLKKMAEK
ncbi:MAG: hypothetical protein HYT27_02050 [Parcubacteria group bacterium]|nr:hypothetical protein [Parcubacteria group bacterium]